MTFTERALELRAIAEAEGLTHVVVRRGKDYRIKITGWLGEKPVTVAAAPTQLATSNGRALLISDIRSAMQRVGHDGRRALAKSRLVAKVFDKAQA